MLKLIGFAFLLSIETGSQSLHVSPAGNDSTGNGSVSNPWKSPATAQEAVRAMVASGLTENVEVVLHSGTYKLSEPLIFGVDDSAPDGKTITYTGTPESGATVLQSASAIPDPSGWEPFTNGIWKINVGPGLDIDTLCEDNIRADEARHPNRGANRLYPQARAPWMASSGGSVESNGLSSITYNTGDMDGINPAAAQHIAIFANENHDWHSWVCAVDSVDTNENRIVFDNQGDSTAVGALARYYLSGSLEYLDARGEFHYNPASGDLFYKPRTPGHPATKNIHVPLLKTLVEIRGADRLATVQGLEFKNMELSGTAAIAPALQWWAFDWGKEDFGVVNLRNTSGVVFDGCHIRNAGRHGILATGHNENIHIQNSLIENCGVSGIILCNRYSGGTADRLRNCTIQNCVVQNVGNLGLYAGCIELMSTENCRVEQCGLYDSARYAVTLRGNATLTGSYNSFPRSTGNVVRNCRIERCMQDSGDGAPIHSAGINQGDRDYINRFENLYIYNTCSILGMNDPSQIAGIHMDWAQATQLQVFSNILVEVSEGPPIKLNNNPTQTYHNVCWEPEFDPAFLTDNTIGIATPLPEWFNVSRPDTHVYRDWVIDNIDPEFHKTGDAWIASQVGRLKAPIDWMDAPKSWFYSKQSTADENHRATWTPNLSEAGYYDIHIWKFQSTEQNATNVDVTIVSAEGTNCLSVNQRDNAMVWEKAGTWFFEAGTSGFVSLNADSAPTGSYVRADAVRFTLAAQSEELLWADDFEAGYTSGTNLIGQGEWTTWAGASPLIATNATDTFLQGVSDDDARAKIPAPVSDSRFITIQSSLSIPNTASIVASQNHIGLGSAAANAVGINVGMNTTGIFISTNGIAMSEFTYGHLDGQPVVPNPGTIYTLRAQLNLLAGTARLFVSTDGTTFQSLDFDTPGGYRSTLPFDTAQAAGWDAVYVRMGQNTGNRIYDISIEN